MAGKKKAPKAQAVDGADVEALAAKLENMKTQDEETEEETEAERKAREKEEGYKRVVDYFKTNYGDTKLETWQAVCLDLGLDEEPSITKCKQALKKHLYHIQDFVDARKKGQKPEPFPSITQLRKYIRTEKGPFPLRWAKKHPMLKWMLVEVYGSWER